MVQKFHKCHYIALMNALEYLINCKVIYNMIRVWSYKINVTLLYQIIHAFCYKNIYCSCN